MLMRVAAALLCAALAGCADDPAAAPAGIEPTAHDLPLPPVKPAHPQTSGLPKAFTDSIPTRPML